MESSKVKPKRWYVVEGADGVGKSMLARQLHCSTKNTSVHICEPSLGPYGVRFTNHHSNLGRMAQIHLLMMDRYWSYKYKVLPNLQHGITVWQDRGWISTCVYQSRDDAHMVELADFFLKNLPLPTAIIYCHAPEEVRGERMRSRGVMDYFDKLNGIPKKYSKLMDHVKSTGLLHVEMVETTRDIVTLVEDTKFFLYAHEAIEATRK